MIPLLFVANRRDLDRTDDSETNGRCLSLDEEGGRAMLSRINVQVQSGRVILRGALDNQRQVQAVVENAHEAGAKSVENRPKIQ